MSHVDFAVRMFRAHVTVLLEIMHCAGSLLTINIQRFLFAVIKFRLIEVFNNKN